MGHDGVKILESDSVEVAIVSSGDVDIITPRACDDVRDMGLLPNLLATDSIPKRAEDVDKRMNARFSKGDFDQGDSEIDMDKNEEESFRDLATRWNAATNEARKVLKLGKRLGMGIIGDEQEAVKEIARLEFGEAE
ncbi:hypothetical protein GQ457_09G014360 [Hibiscus cannabinus]